MSFSSVSLDNFNKSDKEIKREQKTINSKRHQSAEYSNAKKSLGFAYILIIFLPILFLFAIFSKNNFMLIAYGLMSVVVLLVIWIFQYLDIGARTTLTALHIMLSVMALIMITLSPSAKNNQNSDTSIQSQMSITQTNTLERASRERAQVEDNSAKEQAQQAEKEEVRSPVNDTINAFMSAWRDIDYKKMVALSDTDKLNPNLDYETSMFHIRANRTPVSWKIKEIENTDEDQFRTVNMEVEIDKNNGSKNQIHQMQVLLIKKNGNYFVDPKSLNSIGVLRDADSESNSDPVGELPPTPVPDPNMTLYYNPDGGSLYHASQNCSQINQKYLPLKGSFTVSQLDDKEYSKFEPCTFCNAPRRGKKKAQ